MKIAFPARNGQIDGHFGHCEYFAVLTVEDNKVVSEDRVDSPAGCGCKSNVVATLAEMGVSVLMAGSMGQGAVNKLNGHGIEVVRGCSGSMTESAEKWMAGQIKDGGAACTDHGSCGS